ncbi:hypothetical protein ABIE13_002693 [Ottowia thiooxydans]|uniref:Transposase n=1 Tax=Ottowia thiooxydans TaxID=219182 RepID=A0ABV2Q9H8_9BURK
MITPERDVSANLGANQFKIRSKRVNLHHAFQLVDHENLGAGHPLSLTRIECADEPLDASAVYSNDIKAARRGCAKTPQVMPRRKHNALLLDGAYAGRCPSMTRTGPCAHLDEHQRSACGPHHKIYFTTASPWRPIIAIHESQPCAFQMSQRRIFR